MCDPEIYQVNFSHQYNDVKIRKKSEDPMRTCLLLLLFFLLSISHLSPNGFGSLSQIVHSQQKLQQQIYFTTSTNYTEKKGTLYFIIRAIPFIKDSESQNLTRRGGYFRCKKNMNIHHMSIIFIISFWVSILNRIRVRNAHFTIAGCEMRNANCEMRNAKCVDWNVENETNFHVIADFMYKQGDWINFIFA